MFGNHGLCGLPEEGSHGKSSKCLGGNLGDFGEFCKGLKKPIHAELLPRHRFRSDTNRKLHSRNRTGKENAAAVEQPLLLHHLPQTCLKQADAVAFSDDLEI